MTNRLIDISSEPIKLRVKHDQFYMKPTEGETITVPLEEIAAVVISEPQVTYTHSVLTRLSETGVCVVFCGQKKLPVGMLMPLNGHSIQTERFAKQIQSTAPTKKRIWQQLIKAKITAQATVLRTIRTDDNGLAALVGQVKSGDPDNMEGRAAKRYWPRLFKHRPLSEGNPGQVKFRRDRSAEDENQLLNYGYAVLRAVTGRAICSSGLHPSIGIHHHNRYNPFCLADDLMEPFRPLVDTAVVGISDRSETIPTLDKETKAAVLNSLTGRLSWQGEQRSLFDVLSRVTSSLALVFEGKRKSLALPDLSEIPRPGED